MTFLTKFVPLKFRNNYRSKWVYYKNKIKTSLGKLKRIFVRPDFPNLKTGEINLHLGCGSINHPSFINIDGRYDSHVHYVRAISDLSPFKDNSVSLVYACHCLEHLSHIKVSSVLNEWYRVLKSDGTLRISVPDFDLLLDIYKDSNNDLNTIIEPLMGSQDYKYNFHQTVFNYESLTALLKESGFREVRKWQPGLSNLTTFDDWSSRKISINDKLYPVSLNLEAIK